MDLGKKSDGMPYNFYCVDDSAFMLKTITRMLTQFKANIIGDNISSLEALEFIREHKDEIDVVTLDIHMPIMDGMEMIPKIKEIDPQIKILMVSALGDVERVKRTLKLGASHFIVKPFNKVKAFPIVKFVCMSARK